MAHMMARGGMARGRGDREKEREKEKSSYNATVRWGPGGAYLPVILHVVAQADEAGLELLWPQRPAVVLPASEGRCAQGAVWRPGRHQGRERGPGHVQRVGEGDTRGRETQLEVTWTR